MRLAFLKARQSTDLSTQVGAVVVENNELVGSGCNTLPPGVDHDEDRYLRPQKYLYTEHAERWAIYEALRAGNKPDTMYVTWGICADCARAAILCGIRKIYTHSFYDGTAHWTESTEAATLMLLEAGVELVPYHGKVMLIGEHLLFNGDKVHY